MSHLIRNNAIVTQDPWQIVHLPAPTEQVVRKQAGKVVLFKLTGEDSISEEQINNTVIPDGKVIIPFTVWLARKETLQPRLAAGELGVWLDTHELVEHLLDHISDLNIFPVIGVHFERFADGRGYSAAALLRSRHGFKNELRAFGDILRDQLFFLRRCGFNAYQIRTDRSIEEALQGLKDFSEPYQHAADGLAPLWRRHARGTTHKSEHKNVRKTEEQAA